MPEWPIIKLNSCKSRMIDTFKYPMSLNFSKVDIESRVDHLDLALKEPKEKKERAPKKLGGAEAAMAASEELAKLCSMLDEFEEEIETPKEEIETKVHKKLGGAEAAMAASEELAKLCSMYEFEEE